MTRLLHDRYVLFDGTRACDLVSGHEVTLDALPAEDSASAGGSCDLHPTAQARGPHRARLRGGVEACAVGTPDLGLSEVLAHGRDGEPRWVVVDARNGLQAAAIGRRAAAMARRSGFVAVAVEMYLRLCDVLTEDLADRTLLLIGGFAATLLRARAAFIEASARAPRAHVLLTFRSTIDRSHTSMAREARAGYGTARAPAAVRPPGAELTGYVDDIARAERFVLAGRHAAGERLLRKTAAALADVVHSLSRRMR